MRSALDFFFLFTLLQLRVNPSAREAKQHPPDVILAEGPALDPSCCNNPPWTVKALIANVFYLPSLHWESGKTSKQLLCAASQNKSSSWLIAMVCGWRDIISCFSCCCWSFSWLSSPVFIFYFLTAVIIYTWTMHATPPCTVSFSNLIHCWTCADSNPNAHFSGVYV